MIPGNRIWAVIPVKRFSDAKTRLASVLGAAERLELARLMFEDVLDALVQCRAVFAGTLVATSDTEAAVRAKRRGAEVVFDTADRGINAAVKQAVRSIQMYTDDGLMVVPSDIPQVASNTLAQAARAIAKRPSLAIAAAADDRGTNLFACRPAHVIPTCFGPLSFEQHLDAAQQAGVAVQTLCMPELSLDIDRPENLLAFLRLKSPTRTHAFLSGIPVAERIEEYRDFVSRVPEHAAAKV
ncbi:MAG TPA: 2-phospho-L-lactate guanylyltransferase [Pseudolabrys sp.]|nr:2-phospho-L-lactate guanylyltransferase [Pseudolabrys sp.]